MTENIKIPYNDVFFYGLTLKSRETVDVRNDIFSNILMRYLRTLKPAHNRLFRVSDGDKFEYNYSFIPSRPLSWRVLKNRRVIEEIELMSGGKYCLTSYDDQSRAVKRVFFDQNHKWMKTNYFSSLANDSIICSIVPKENNGQTLILRYDTRKLYPITMYPCPSASCDEVLNRVLSRVPEPELTALTNYGLLYFASEDTHNIYTQVLKEEEEKYQQETKPPVYTTDEDVANGFCFSKDSFACSADNMRVDLSEALELSDDNSEALLSDRASALSTDKFASSEPSDKSISADAVSSLKLTLELPDNPHDAIAEAIDLISDRTDLKLDKDEILGSSEPDDKNNKANESVILNTTDDAVCEPLSEKGGYTIGEGHLFSDPLSMPDNNEIDDYVSSLIDTLLMSAKAAVNEYRVGSEENFEPIFAEETDQSAEISDDTEMSGIEAYRTVADTVNDEFDPDSVIESNGCRYMYFGKLDADGKRTGRGKTLMENGNTAYDGEYLEDMRDGEGSFYYKDGTLCYWGSWKENMRSGFGLGISSETGVTHIGEWQDNKPCGTGIRFDRNGGFLYLDSDCERANGGMRVTALTSDSVTVEYWDEKTLKTVRKVITADDLLNNT